MNTVKGRVTRVIVTGSSGFVAASLVPLVRTYFEVVGVDRKAGVFTNLHSSISDCESLMKEPCDFFLVHLAAARFDHGATAFDYYKDNVSETEALLSKLSASKLKGFLHVSSVAAFEGAHLTFHDMLGCDDAYRVTKYLQEKLVRNWTKQNNIPLHIFYPSAIFSGNKRSDTNIGKLQTISAMAPFVPAIPSRKSLTYLPAFNDFVLRCLKAEIAPGRYLVIERPVLTVSEILKALSLKKRALVRIPMLKGILYGIAWSLWIIGLCGRIDMKLTPNRVKKLFADSDYDTVPEGVDCYCYNRGREATPEILAKVKRSL